MYVFDSFYEDDGEFETIVKEAREDVIRRTQVQQLHIPEIWETFADDDVDYTNQRPSGFKILDDMIEGLDSLYRSEVQKEIHNLFLQASMRLIFGRDLHKHKYEVVKRYKFKNLKQQAIGSCPRRTGKSYASAMYCALAAACIPVEDFIKDGATRGLIVSIFSPSKRQSVAMINHIMFMLDKLGLGTRVVRKTEERIYLLNNYGQIAQINGYPCVAKTLRGVNGDILLLEEMAHIGDSLINEVIWPLFQIDQTCLLGISTVLNDENIMSRYIDMVDTNGEKLFNVKELFLACENCIANGNEASCNHNTGVTPLWQSIRKQKFLRNVMRDDPELMNQELGGIIQSANETAFKQKFVKALFKREPYRYGGDTYIPYVFISLDPSGNGSKSDVAITTISRHLGQYIVIGMESYNSKFTYEGYSLLLAHVRKIEEIYAYRDVLKVFILENNMVGVDTYAKTIQDNVDRYVILSTCNGPIKSSNDIGLRTTNETKKMSVELVNKKLVDGGISIYDESEFVTVSGTYQGMREMLEKQMNNFSRVILEKKNNIVDKPNVTYSGKSKGKDDLMMSFLLACYWSNLFFTDPKYSNLLHA